MMPFDWSTLGGRAPTTLVRARSLSHHALQWAARAARANLAAVPDDSHLSMEWDAAHALLLSQPLASNDGEIRIGLDIAGLALTLWRGKVCLDTFELSGRRDSVVGVWLDSALRTLGLKPASDVRLPYAVAASSVSRGGAYNSNGEGEALHELARWFGTAADLLGQVSVQLSEAYPGTGPVRCWPHHFNMAFLVALAGDSAEPTTSAGIGFSPGDEHYPQPYVYLSSSPRLNSTDLPPLPAPGHWHVHGFVGAVVTGEEILMLSDRTRDLRGFIGAAFDIVRTRVAGSS